jgi:hypothetical protein
MLAFDDMARLPARLAKYPPAGVAGADFAGILALEWWDVTGEFRYGECDEA